MRIPFTKMQGAGNDFVVLDETRSRYGLTAAHYRFLADRHFGVGADQILTVRASDTPGIDFSYVIHNADGGEVEHCGNGARCFLAYVRRHGLTTKDLVTVQTMNRVLQLQWHSDARVTVDMQAPEFELADVPFDPQGLQSVPSGGWCFWPLVLDGKALQAPVNVAILSMGNPHAVTLVDDVDSAPVSILGPLIQSLSAFAAALTWASCRCRTARISVCALTSVALARHWLAAPVPARQWWRASGWACWTPVWTWPPMVAL